MNEWHFRWFCECGHDFEEGHDSKFLTFGFCTLCPVCGNEIGSQSCGEVLRKKCRWKRKDLKFHILQPYTWIPQFELEEFKNE